MSPTGGKTMRKIGAAVAVVAALFAVLATGCAAQNTPTTTTTYTDAPATGR